MVSLICEICFKPFEVEPYRSSARFCGMTCKNAGHSKDLFKQKKRTCPVCGKQFHARPSSKQITCSFSCGHVVSRAKILLKPKDCVRRICKMCGKEFFVVPSSDGRMCSKACADASFKRRITLKCKACGNSFEARAHHTKQKFCSRRCRTIGIGKSETDIENIMRLALAAHAIPAIAQFPMDSFIFDFAIPESKIIIECDGSFWHSKPDVISRDARKDRALATLGWRMLRFSDKRIKHHLPECISEVQRSLRTLAPEC